MPCLLDCDSPTTALADADVRSDPQFLLLRIPFTGRPDGIAMTRFEGSFTTVLNIFLMSVERGGPHHVTAAGHDYAFCSSGCREVFTANPALFIGSASPRR